MAGGISHDNARFRFLPGLFEGKKKCPTSPYQQPSNNYNQGYRPPSNNYNNQGYRPPNNYNNNYRPPTSSYNSNQSYRPPQTSYVSQPSSTYQSSSNYRPPSNYQSSYTPPSNNYQSSQYRDPIPPLSYPSRGWVASITLLGNCVTQLQLYTLDKLSSPIFCCLSVCLWGIGYTLPSLHFSPLHHLYYLI